MNILVPLGSFALGCMFGIGFMCVIQINKEDE